MKCARLLLICIIVLCGCAGQQAGFVQEHYSDEAAYLEARQRLIKAERALRFDTGITLRPEEEEANRRLMALKREEIERTQGHFPPAHSFLESRTRKLIAESRVLQIMKRMPKGGILHVHGFTLGDFRWLVTHATYLPNSYIYQGDKSQPVRGTLRFFQEPPGDGWVPISELRNAAKDVQEFDEEIYRSITLGEEDLAQPDIWTEFSKSFRAIGLLTDDSVREGYYRKMFKDLAEENIQYVEFRGAGSSAFQALLSEILRDHPDFEVKFIPQAMRSASREQLAEALERILDRREADPHRILGFDLVEEEDSTHTNLFFLNELLNARREAERRNITLPLYLHSGESNWMENENLYDAILLDAKRIGHGLALIKHPLLMQIVRERDIAIEVCPISNQVLGYISDLRNHPAVHYINSGLPVVLSPDDPGIMQHTLSYDFYTAFMAWGLDLKGLKQLAMNSLLYSAMEPEEKERSLLSWRKKWAEFVAWMNENISDQRTLPRS